MLVPELLGLLDPVPGAVDDADASLLDVLEVLAVDGLFGEGRQDDASEFLLLVLYVGQQLEALHLLAGALLGVAVLEIHHEEGDCLLGLHYLLPLATLLLLFLLSFLLPWLFLVDIDALQFLLYFIFLLIFLHDLYE